MLTRRSLLAGLALAAGSARAAEAVDVQDLYDSVSGPTDLARALDGRRIRLTGFMAPPLRADARFFVLMPSPSPVCPFCDDAEEWPESIMAVYTERVVEVAPFYQHLAVEGVLTLGVREDPDTGFVSPLRLERARYEAI